MSVEVAAAEASTSAEQPRQAGERKRTRAPREDRDALKESKRKAKDDAAALAAAATELVAATDAHAPGQVTEPWAWYPLADPTALTCPVVFSPDSLCVLARARAGLR